MKNNRILPLVVAQVCFLMSFELHSAEKQVASTAVQAVAPCQVAPCPSSPGFPSPLVKIKPDKSSGKLKISKPFKKVNDVKQLSTEITK